MVVIWATKAQYEMEMGSSTNGLEVDWVVQVYWYQIIKQVD